MKIIFKTTKADEQFNSRYKRKWTYPKQVQIKLLAAENFIHKAASLRDIANFAPFHFEKLKGDRKDEWSIRLGKTGYRIILYPCDNCGNIIIGGDILRKCNCITIIMVTEVTKHYE